MKGGLFSLLWGLLVGKRRGSGRDLRGQLLEVRSSRSDLPGQIRACREAGPVDPAGSRLTRCQMFTPVCSVRNVADWDDLRASARESHSWPLADTVFFSSIAACCRRELVSSPPAAASSRGGGRDELLCPRTSWAVIFLADRC